MKKNSGTSFAIASSLKDLPKSEFLKLVNREKNAEANEFVDQLYEAALQDIENSRPKQVIAQLN